MPPGLASMQLDHRVKQLLCVNGDDLGLLDQKSRHDKIFQSAPHND